MLEVLIIGAGTAGLVAAKTILECEGQNVDIRLVDTNKTVGGVWAKENLYLGLRTNNQRGGLDFSDFPMDDSFGVPHGSAISGEAMHEYLDRYAKKWDLHRRIDFETYVEEVGRLDSDDGWKVRVKRIDGSKYDYEAAKLIVATGITNRPHHPRLPDTTAYGCPIVHSTQLGKKADVITSRSVETVTVLGGAKSAYDAVHLAASTGKRVHWIIRKSGKGPGWVFPPLASLGPFKALRERLVVRRFISCLSPYIWDDGMGRLRNFLHHSWLGKKITQAFWGDIHHVTLDDCRYQKETCLNLLEPEQSPFWYGTATGVYNYPEPNDVYHYIRTGQVTVHRADISAFSSHTIHLSDATSTTITSDLLITATGFSAQPSITFHPSISHSGLGLPSNSLTPEQSKFWSDLTATADTTIGAKFPRLVGGPFQGPKSNVVKPFKSTDDPNATFTPWRLWRGMAPPGPTGEGRCDLVFLGMMIHLANTVKLEIQCLWAWAYLTGRLDGLQALDNRKFGNGAASSVKINSDKHTHSETTPLLANKGPGTQSLSATSKTIYTETALWTRYWHLRAPYGHGRYHPDVVFDQIPLWDMWIRDLGLKTWRKSDGRRSGWGWNPRNWFRELFEPYTVEDYRGLVGEWLESRKGIQTRKGSD